MSVEPTARDIVFSQLLESEDKIAWTVDEMVAECNGRVSRYTVRNTFNSLTSLGVMNHKSGSPYWYFL